MTDKQKAALKTAAELERTANAKKGEPCEPLLRGYIRRLEIMAGVPVGNRSII